MAEYITRNNPNNDDDYDYEYDDEGNIVYYAVRPNKTQIKKDIAVLLAVGEQISNLPSAQITALNLPKNSKHQSVKLPKCRIKAHANAN